MAAALQDVGEVSMTVVDKDSDAYRKALIVECRTKGTEHHVALVNYPAVIAVQESCATSAEYERKRKRDEEGAVTVPASRLSTKNGLVITREVIKAGR